MLKIKRVCYLVVILLTNNLYLIYFNYKENKKRKKMEQVKCNTCEEMVNSENASEYGYYDERWICEPCTEIAEILADESLTPEERVKVWD